MIRRRHGGGRRVLGGAMALLVGCGIAMAAPQAAQASYTSWVAASSWAYTDSRDADALHVGEAGGLPVGTWLDAAGKHHMSRAYFTFDLRPYAGKQILRAMGVVDEIAVNDCGTARDWELWRTDPVSSATDWRNPPAEVERLDDPVPSPACPAHYSEALLTGVFQRALGEGRESVTLELRIPADREGNPHLGRRVAPLHVSMTANATPDAPTELSVDAKSCASGDPLWVSDLRPNLRALLADPDSAPPGDAEPLTATFALWPIDQPDARVEWTYGQLSAPFYASTTVPAGAIEDGKSYAFAVRSADGDAESQWSAPCSFTVDSVRPRVTPTISSEDFQDYPAKGYVGVPGTFTFTANGVADVVGFYWGEWLPGTFVAADRPGGSATVTWTPTSEGPASIRVMSVDRAGNTSDSASYSFRITSSAPSVQDTTPDAWPGDAHTLLIRAGLPDTASYAYSLDDGAEQTVTAAADGTAQLSVTPKLTGSWFSIHGIGAAGQVSATTRVFLTVQSAPIVTSTQFPQNGVGAPVGTEGVFHFAPRMSGVTQYLYSYDSGPWQTVTAGQDGAADITLRPATPGTHRLVVYSRTTDGVDSMRTAYYFSPASIAPNVDSPDYPEGIEAGGPGITGRFVFTPVADDVVEYVYSVNGGPEQTIAADPMGWGVLDWAPPGIGEDNSGLFIMRVRSRSGDGQVSDAREYWIVAALLAPGVESDIFDPFGTAKVGQPGVFTFTSHQPDAVEFVYSIDGGPQQTLPVGSDGRSTLSFTADSPYSHDVVVRTRRADGVTSGSDFLSFWVAPAE